MMYISVCRSNKLIEMGRTRYFCCSSAPKGPEALPNCRQGRRPGTDLGLTNSVTKMDHLLTQSTVHGRGSSCRKFHCRYHDDKVFKGSAHHHRTAQLVHANMHEFSQLVLPLCASATRIEECGLE